VTTFEDLNLWPDTEPGETYFWDSRANPASEYYSGHLIRDTSSSPLNPTPEMLLARLEAAANIVRKYQDSDFDGLMAWQLADYKTLCEVMAGIEHFIPKVVLWCVVKQYTGAGVFKEGEESVTLGFTTEAQAKRFRDYIEQCYANPSRKIVYEKWIVKIAACRPHEVVAPDATPEVRCRGWGK